MSFSATSPFFLFPEKMEKGHRAPYPAAACPSADRGIAFRHRQGYTPILHIPFNSRGRRPGKVPIMITLLLTVFLVVLISAICSMTEAALYSVPLDLYRKPGAKQGSRHRASCCTQLSFPRIDQHRRPSSTLNTVAKHPPGARP